MANGNKIISYMALAALHAHSITENDVIDRHRLKGDWGEIDNETRINNIIAHVHGKGAILSIYALEQATICIGENAQTKKIVVCLADEKGRFKDVFNL